jgi:excisionase family DNA binding protein
MPENTHPEPIAVTIRTAGQLSGLGKTKLYELIDNGALSTLTIGRRRLVHLKSLKALLAVGSEAQS